MQIESEKSSRRFPTTRIISLVSLALAVTALLLALKKPQPVAVPQAKKVVAANAQSFQAKVDQLAQPPQPGETPAPVHLTADEVRAAFSQLGDASAQLGSIASSTVGSGSIDEVSVGEPIVSFEGDEMKGQFVSELAGKKVYITVNGRLGAKDGYATFQPTEFKVGDLTIPVSVVNDALQKKMLEQRDRLKLPDYVSDLRVENGELVVTRR